MQFGIISDTHGLLRPEAATALTGTDLILHVGDVGTPEVLEKLGQIAPVIAVRGNVDCGPWAEALPLTWEGEWQGKRIFMIHILADLPAEVNRHDYDLVLFGHSHKPTHYREGPTLFVNPGSAGRRRFSLPITLAKGFIEQNEFKIESVNLIGEK